MRYCHHCGAQFNPNALGRRRFLCDGCRYPSRRTDIHYGALTMPYIDTLVELGKQHGIETYRDLSVAMGLNYRYFENIVYRLYRIPVTNVTKKTVSKIGQWECAVEKDGR